MAAPRFRPPVLHAVRSGDGSLLGTYAEERPLTDVAPPSDARELWERAAAADDAWRAECGPRLVKIALPVMASDERPRKGQRPQPAAPAPPPILIDVYLQPAATLQTLDASRSFDVARVTAELNAVPAAPDFVVYCGDLAAQGTAAATINRAELWDPEEFERIFRDVTAAELPDSAWKEEHNKAQRSPGSPGSPRSPGRAASPLSRGSSVSTFRIRRRQRRPNSPTGSEGTLISADPADTTSRQVSFALDAADAAAALNDAGGEAPISLDASYTRHSRVVDMHYHRTMTAFCHWAHRVVRRAQTTTAANVLNDRFRFEFDAVIKPRLDAGSCIVGVRDGARDTQVFVRFDLFAEGTEHRRRFLQLVTDIADAWSIAETADLDDEDPEDAHASSEASYAIAQVTARSVCCRVAFSFTMPVGDPAAVPATTPMVVDFNAFSRRADEAAPQRAGVNTTGRRSDIPPAAAIADMLQRRLQLTPVPPPAAGRDESLLDILPAMETHLVDTVVEPAARWLQLVGAFRAAFGPCINDPALGAVVDVRTVQFLVLDQHSVQQLAVIVSLTWQAPVPLVTYTSAQHASPGGAPITFSWIPPPPAPSVAEPSSVAASAYAYLHDNFHKLVRVVEARGMHAHAAAPATPVAAQPVGTRR